MPLASCRITGYSVRSLTQPPLKPTRCDRGANSVLGHKSRWWSILRVSEAQLPRDQRWFELRDRRARSMDRDAWVVLRAAQRVGEGPEDLIPGHAEEHFAVASASIPIAHREIAEKTISWHNLSLMNDHAPCVQDGEYQGADLFQPYPGEIRGTNLVLSQRGNRIEASDWHVHQDLVLGLGLKREGDNWLAIDEGYPVVIRLSRSKDGSPALMEIRSSHLKDFLGARNECLCVSSYRSRELILSEKPQINWNARPTVEQSSGQKWQGTITEITEHGHEYGSEIAVLHVGRKDFDREQDVPEIGVSDEFSTSAFTKKAEGKKSFRIWGELWMVEFVEPGQHSVRVRGDDVASQVFFFVDGSGQRESAESLDRKGRWLWFKPDVINKALEYRGATLEWYTAQTGRIDMGSGGGVHFGVNKLGLVNVYAKDIRNSSAWQQQVWAGFNVIPDGGVSEELLMAQAEGEPARTQAPEAFLMRSINVLNQNAKRRFGIEMIKSHSEHDRLLRLIHRFRAVDEAGFYALAKDLARLTADSIDFASLQKIVPVPKGEKRGSLKSLESVIATVVVAEEAHRTMTPLFGTYELRLADAHLPPSDLKKAFEMVNAKREAPWIDQGLRLLDSVVSALSRIAICISLKGESRSE
jgi:hypothetical protein